MGFFSSLGKWFGGGGPTPRAEASRLRGRVAHLEAQVEALAEQTGADISHVVAEGPCSAEVMQLLRDGKPVHAIKVHREQTGLSLIDAKADVDEAARSLGPDASSAR